MIVRSLFDTRLLAKLLGTSHLTDTARKYINTPAQKNLQNLVLPSTHLGCPSEQRPDNDPLFLFPI